MNGKTMRTVCLVGIGFPSDVRARLVSLLWNRNAFDPAAGRNRRFS
jgi:hypothetical protein